MSGRVLNPRPGFGRWLVLLGACAWASPAVVAAEDYPVPPPKILAQLAAGDSSSRSVLLNGSPAVDPRDGLAGVLNAVWQESSPVREALAELEATGFELKDARTGFYPYLEVNAAQGDESRTAVSASIVQPLWDGGRTRADVNGAKARQERALARVQQRRLQVGLEAAEDYLDICHADEAANLWRNYLQELQALEGLVQRRVKQGAAAAADLELTRVRRQQASAGEMANQASQLQARAALAALYDGEVVAGLWPAAAASAAESDSGQADSERLARHPAYQRASAELKLQTALLKRERAGYWPLLSVQHVRQLEQQRGDFTPDDATQLVLQYQTGTGLSAYRGQQAQNSRVQAAQDALTQVARDIRRDLQAAAVLRRSAERQFAAHEAALDASRGLVASYLRQFKGGRKTWLELLNAQREAHEAALQALGAKRDYWRGNLQLSLQGMDWQRLSPGADAWNTEAGVSDDAQ